ncbi:hypothetical protein [Evansella cellulosilytica]|nr:hypothetical protein [Evansella cellulosilytica]
MKIKSVAFNVEDPDQAKLFEHAAERPNFSSYIKRLIQRDMEGGNNIVPSTVTKESTNDNGDDDLMELLV